MPRKKVGRKRVGRKRKPLEQRSKSALVAKAKKRGIRITKKNGTPKTKAQLIKSLRKR